MPLTDADLPHEVQVAFFMYRLLTDNWDGASGAYFGKDWAPIQYYFELYDIDNKITVLEIMKILEFHSIDFQNDQTTQKRKTAERAASAKNYAHNVKG
jgi:hypothetical protein